MKKRKWELNEEESWIMAKRRTERKEFNNGLAIFAVIFIIGFFILYFKGLAEQTLVIFMLGFAIAFLTFVYIVKRKHDKAAREYLGKKTKE